MNGTAGSAGGFSTAEDLQLPEDPSDGQEETSGELPLYDWQKDELARRKANLTANPGFALTWEVVQQRARMRYAR